MAKLPSMAFRNSDPQLPFLERPEIEAAVVGGEVIAGSGSRQIDHASSRGNAQRPERRAHGSAVSYFRYHRTPIGDMLIEIRSARAGGRHG
jgi:hypothetical protein